MRDNLDDPQGYCVDVTGFGASLRLDAPLQAHTCKPRADDQLFTLEPRDDTGAVGISAYGRCLAATAAGAGANLILAPCDAASTGQGFRWLEGGGLSLSATVAQGDAGLCIVVASGVGEPAGGRNHLRRDLALDECAGADPSLAEWELAKQ